MSTPVSSFKIVIPSRYASSRLPGKPLLDIGGKSLVRRVYELAEQMGAEEVRIATDDARIEAAAANFSAPCSMTSPDHASGTERLAEVAQAQNWDPDTIVVNLQGDEPFVPPSLVKRLVQALQIHPSAGIATAATPIHDPEELFSPNAVKVVFDAQGLAHYFSRAPIPWNRDAFATAEGRNTLPPGTAFFRHIGLYVYRVRTLLALAQHPPTPHEQAESLEQLRALHLGIDIHVSTVAEPPPPGIDTPADLEAARRILASGGGHLDGNSPS